MAQPLKLLRDHLQNAGYSLTKPRRIVFEALRDQEAMTMRELTALVGGQADRASIYRTISLFEQLGIVQRLQIGWKYKIELSHTFSNHHHHLICTNCGKVLTFEESLELEEEIERTAWRHQFKISEHQLEIRGLCAECVVLDAIDNIGHSS